MVTVAPVATVVWLTADRDRVGTRDPVGAPARDGGPAGREVEDAAGREAGAAPPAWSLAGDRDPGQRGQAPPPRRSGTRAQTVTAGDALTIDAPENALDRDRALKVTRLDETGIRAFARQAPYPGMGVFDAYAFEAGLRPGDAIPGTFQIVYDLSRTAIPPELHGDVRVIRVGETPGDHQLLASHLEGSRLIAESSRNSVIGFTILGIVYASAVAYQNGTEMGRIFGTDPYLSFSDRTLNRYTVYWPKDLGFGDPDALRQVWTEEVALYKAHGALPEDYDPAADIEAALRTSDVYSPVRLAIEHLQRSPGIGVEHRLVKVMNTPGYRALRERCTPEWMEQHVLPKQVPLTVRTARHADTYLYTTRQFLAPASVDVYISHKETNLGSSSNPALMNPYLMVQVLPRAVVDAPELPGSKAVLDNYLVTFTHELFHVTQSARYLWGVDWSANTWFWEATATVLENEAAVAYADGGLIDKGFVPERHAYDEAHLRALGLTSYWGPLADDHDARQDQGYMMGYFLLYLRDHCAAIQGLGPEYLKRLMNAFKGSLQGPLYTIIEQTTNSFEMMELELKRYYLGRAEAIARRFDVAAKDTSGPFHGWATEKELVLSAADPVAELTPTKNPLASAIRPLAFRLDKGKYSKAADVTLVVRRGDDPMQNNQDLALQVGDGAFRFRELTEAKIQAFPGFGLQDYGYVQEIHLYPDGWLNDFAGPYQVFILLKPDAPRLSLDKGKLTIELPAMSPLKARGLVDQYMVTVKGSDGALLLLATDKDRLELSVGPSGALTDVDDPAVRKMMTQALAKYLDAHPEERAALEARYGKDATRRAIDGTAKLDLDLGTLGRAADVLRLAQGGAAASGEITVAIQEMTPGDRPIYGPVSDAARQVVDAQPTAKVSILGTWAGKVQLGGQSVTVVISPGSHGYDYVIENSMYGNEVAFYGRDNANGTVDVVMSMPGARLNGSEKAFTTLVKNSDTELYLIAPPITLRRK